MWREDTQSGSNYIKLLKRQQLPATKDKDTATSLRLLAGYACQLPEKEKEIETESESE